MNKAHAQGPLLAAEGAWSVQGLYTCLIDATGYQLLMTTPDMGASKLWGAGGWEIAASPRHSLGSVLASLHSLTR